MLITDHQIEELSLGEKPLISPLVEANLNSYGYDLTLADEFLLPSGPEILVDPFNPPRFDKIHCSGVFVLEPGCYVLGGSVETLHMPDNLTGICTGRSTYARAGILVNTTAIEAGWTGIVTISISNLGTRPVKLHVGKGIAQVLFMQSGYLPDNAYSGRYQNQKEVTQGLMLSDDTYMPEKCPHCRAGGPHSGAHDITAWTAEKKDRDQSPSDPPPSIAEGRKREYSPRICLLCRKGGPHEGEHSSYAPNIATW